jgi:hypothetical protein
MEFASLGQAQRSVGKIDLSKGVACEENKSVPNDPVLLQSQLCADHFVPYTYKFGNIYFVLGF